MLTFNADSWFAAFMANSPVQQSTSRQPIFFIFAWPEGAPRSHD